jgi:hypothetical protein
MQRAWIGTALVLMAGLVGGDAAARGRSPEAEIGREVAIPRHLRNGDEHELSLRRLLGHGEALFRAVWTEQEGGGRPLSKGTGAPVSDPDSPLTFPRNFNRVSARDANSCAGCHNAPFAVPGGGGDFVTGVFVLGQRFDFASFDPDDPIALRGTLDEGGMLSTLDSIANFRATLGMFGSGYLEMLARQISEDLRAARDGLAPGGATKLHTKGIDFGVLARRGDGSWDVSGVEGLPITSLRSSGAGDPPSLIVRPFHQAGAVVSVREFTNNAYNHHHGMQSEERFGAGVDADGDGFVDELTRADVTAATVYQATLPVPGRVIPRSRRVERAIARGERVFADVGCSDCHLPSLPLDDGGWVYSEPNPFNPPGNLQPGEAPTLFVDLNDPRLPGPRLRARRGVVHVPAFTDLKLHDITTGPDDPNCEPLDQTQPGGSDAFFAGNCRFLTKKLWGAANEPPFFHHGKFTTLRQSVEAHAGEAEDSRAAYDALSSDDQDALIEFLKSLQVLPPGSRSLVVDEHGRPRTWPGLFEDR